ncbi:hypothetical protein Tco_1481301 [Tanacetum coccineum]
MDSLVVAIPFQNKPGHTLKMIDSKYVCQPPRDTCKIFDHNDDQCPKKVKVVVPNQVSNDRFVEVTRKHGKGKQNSKSRHIDGVRLTKPKPNYYYRPVSKPVNMNGEASTSQPNVNKERSTPKPNNKGKDVSNLQEIIVSLQTSFDTLMEKDKKFKVNNETWKASNDVGSILDDSDSEEVEMFLWKIMGNTWMTWLMMQGRRNDDMGQAAEESSHENAYSVDGFHKVIGIFCESIYVCFIGCVAFALR